MKEAEALHWFWHAMSVMFMISLITCCVMAAQVPQAPSSCCLAFSPATAVGGGGTAILGSDWAVHGEEGSRGALHIMPGWAEVSTVPQCWPLCQVCTPRVQSWKYIAPSGGGCRSAGKSLEESWVRQHIFGALKMVQETLQHPLKCCRDTLQVLCLPCRLPLR